MDMKTSLASRKAIVGIAAIAISALISAPVQAQVIAPGDTIAGLSQQELAARWYQWAFPLPVGTGPNLAQTSANPIVETRGHASHLGNNFVPGVSFLAGVASSVAGTDTANRYMTIPQGNTIFFPIINANVDNTVPPGDTPTNFTIDGMLTSDFGLNYIAMFANPISLFVTLDGNPIGNLLDHTQINGGDGFTITYTQADNMVTAFGWDPTFNTGVYPSDVQTGAIGYWVGLTLPNGNHTLQFGGEIPVLDPNGQPITDENGQPFTFTQNISYNLQVGAPEPGSLLLLLPVAAIVAARRCRKSR